MKRAAVSKRDRVTREAATLASVGIGAPKRTAKAGTASLPIAHPSAKINATRKRRVKGLLFRSPDGDVVRVKNGFSWDAFFVGSTSTFFTRLWPVMAAGLIAFMVASYFDGVPMPSSRGAGVAAVAAIFYVAYMVFCGINGNAWLAQSLRRRGYVVVGEP